MNLYLSRIVDYANRMHLDIISQDEAEALIVVNDEKRGIYRLVIDCEDPILIMEQLIYHVENSSKEHFEKLLKMNRNLVHGAFVLDEEGKRVIFRDTLQIENLDYNEFQGSINALSLAMAEYSNELVQLNN